MNSESYVSYNPPIILSHDLTIGEAGYEKCDPLHFWGPGMRNFYTFHYVISGKGSVSMNGADYSLRAGDFFLIKTDDWVYYEADELDAWEYRWVSFNGASAKRLASSLTLYADNPIVNLNEVDGQVCNRLLENICMRARASAYPHLAALGHLYLFIEWLMSRFAKPAVSERDGGGKEYFYAAINYININLSSSLTVERVVKHIGYDRTYLFKLFKKHIGVSPSFFIEALKIYRACDLIDTNKYSLKEVANRCGFADYSWFSKVFHRIAGITPGAYASPDKKAEVRNCYNLTIPRDVLSDLETYSDKHMFSV